MNSAPSQSHNAAFFNKFLEDRGRHRKGPAAAIDREGRQARRETGRCGQGSSNWSGRSASSASEPTTCAKLCRKSGEDLEQIKFLLGHSSIQTTERYLGSEQDIAIAVNDSLGL
jgi:integrase